MSEMDIVGISLAIAIVISAAAFYIRAVAISKRKKAEEEKAAEEMESERKRRAENDERLGRLIGWMWRHPNEDVSIMEALRRAQEEANEEFER